MPRVDAAQASRRSSGIRVRPLADAVSTTAVRRSSSAKRASTGSPSGPLATHATIVPTRAATSASSVPSPPSAIGIPTAVPPISRTPAATASVTAAAENVPLKLSGAIRIVGAAIGGVSSVERGPGSRGSGA